VTRPPRVVVVGGTTAGGKSALALALAERLNGELVGADSRQLYAGLAVASAGPDDDERARVPHHLYGAVSPQETLSAGRFVAMADDAIAAITARGHTAVVVGGTGLYLRALRTGLDDALPSDVALRARLNDDLQAHGVHALVERLRTVDLAAIDGLDTKNPVRVVRALELALLGARASARDVDAVLRRPPRAVVDGACWLLLERDPAKLGERIATRTAAMFATTRIVDEATALAALLPAEHALLQTIGVAEALAVARGALSVDDAIAQTATRTRQYARRQRTWFKKEPWWTRIDADADTDAVVAAALAVTVRDAPP
jgi:tRNA dimethylallyltransferase